MLSVTKRTNTFPQPPMGFLPPKKLQVKCFFDDEQIIQVESMYKPIQGMVVDYLTRYLNGTPKIIAFKISLLGADIVNEREKALSLLEIIDGLNEISILAACQLVGYDVAYRKGAKWFVPVEQIVPTDSVIQNITILTQRSLLFIQNYGPVVKDGFSFEGGYNEIISKGDGDYLTIDTLWDFKVSAEKPTSKHMLQLLVYYVLGVHSIHPEFQNIKKLGIFNPELNMVFDIKVSDIPDEVFQAVCRDVIGYYTPSDPKQWRLAEGTNPKVVNEIIKCFFTDLFVNTGFAPDKYDDGIYDITLDDYWSYYKTISKNVRPRFVHTHSVKFIKHAGFFMFVSLTERGTMSVMQGGTLRRLERPLQYYYDHLPEYGAIVLKSFSKYWDALYSISKQLKAVVLSDEEIISKYKAYCDECNEQKRVAFEYETWCKNSAYSDAFAFSGCVHGCIVDMDYFNHVYLNPFDGTLVPYSATSMYMRRDYRNLPSLIKAHRPDMLAAFNRTIDACLDGETKALLLGEAKAPTALSLVGNNETDNNDDWDTDTDMYRISNRLKLLQMVYDHNLIVVWYDNVLPNRELASKSGIVLGSMIGETKVMKCGMKATVISDKGYKSITVKFEDGTVLENCRRDKFREGRISNPTLRRNASMGIQTQGKVSYVGRTAVMKCGLKATVIEDYGWNNITVQFEDGLIRKNCRRENFVEGKISHKERKTTAK